MAFDDEYISKKEAILAVTNDGCTANVVDVLYHLPSADVVEVVRCKDCKHWREAGTGWRGIHYGYCHNIYNEDFSFHCEHAPTTGATDFCGWGRKKGD